MNTDNAWFELRLTVNDVEVERPVELAMERLVTRPTVAAVQVYQRRDGPSELLVVLRFADETALDTFGNTRLPTMAATSLERAGIEVEWAEWIGGALGLAGMDGQGQLLDTTSCDC